MKKVIPFFLLIVIFSSGFARKFKSGIIFNNTPITIENAMDAQRTFKRGNRVYYLFMSNKPIKSQFLRIQVVRASDRVPIITYSVVYGKDVKVMKDAIHYYSDYVVFHSNGHYIMAIYDRNNLHKPLARSDFYVK